MENNQLLYTGTLRGTLISCHLAPSDDWDTAQKWELDFVWEVRAATSTETYTPPSGKVFHLRGRPTGYEGFYIEPRNYQGCLDHGWTACHGTKGRWDRLEISAAEMRRVFQEANLIPRETV